MTKYKAPRRNNWFNHQILAGIHGQFLQSKGDARYGAQAWLVCRNNNIALPDWAISALDYSARTALLVSPLPRSKGQGQGPSRPRLSKRKETKQIMEAWALYWSHPEISDHQSIDWCHLPSSTLASFTKQWRQQLKAMASSSGGPARPSRRSVSPGWEH